MNQHDGLRAILDEMKQNIQGKSDSLDCDVDSRAAQLSMEWFENITLYMDNMAITRRTIARAMAAELRALDDQAWKVV